MSWIQPVAHPTAFPRPPHIFERPTASDSWAELLSTMCVLIWGHDCWWEILCSQIESVWCVILGRLIVWGGMMMTTSDQKILYWVISDLRLCEGIWHLVVYLHFQVHFSGRMLFAIDLLVFNIHCLDYSHCDASEALWRFRYYYPWHSRTVCFVCQIWGTEVGVECPSEVGLILLWCDASGPGCSVLAPGSVSSPLCPPLSLWSCLHSEAMACLSESDPNGITVPSKGSVHELGMTLIWEAHETAQSSTHFTPIHSTASTEKRHRKRWNEMARGA